MKTIIIYLGNNLNTYYLQKKNLYNYPENIQLKHS